MHTHIQITYYKMQTNSAHMPSILSMYFHAQNLATKCWPVWITSNSTLYNSSDSKCSRKI